MALGTDKQIRTYKLIGWLLIAGGFAVGLLGALVAYYTGLPEETSLGVEWYSAIPRGWQFVLLGQLISLTGAFIFLGGITLAYLFRRRMTWARAAVGATVFVALMMIVFGIIPNEWLTLTQSQFEWIPSNIAFTLPSWLVLGNEVSISYAVFKDIVSGTYSAVALVGTGVVMYWWQEREKKAATAPPPEPVSPYGRPLTKVQG